MSSIRTASALAFIALVVVVAVAGLWSENMARAARSDATWIGAATWQRALAQQVVAEALAASSDGGETAAIFDTAAMARLSAGVLALATGGAVERHGGVTTVSPPDDARVRAALAEAREAVGRLESALTAAVGESATASPPTAALDALPAVAGEVMRSLDAVVLAVQEQAEARTARQRLTAVLAAVAGVLGLGALFGLFTRHVLRPIAALETARYRVAQGDLDYAPDVRVRNELGRLATAFQEMQRQVRGQLWERDMRLKLARALADVDDESDLMEAVAGVAREALGADRVAHMRLDGSRQWLVMAESSGPLGAGAQALRQPWAVEGGTVRCPVERCPIVRGGLAFPCRYATESLDTPASLAGPISEEGGDIRGVLCAWSGRAREWAPHQMEFLSLATREASARLAQIRLRKTADEASALRAADHLKDEFISLASHEIRTPLTSLLGYSELLTSDAEVPEETRRKGLETIHRESQRLVSIVDDMLNVSRMQSGKLTLAPEPVSLAASVAATVARIAPTTAKHEFLADIPEDVPDVWADRDKLEQVLANLVSNAVKYSPRGGAVRISARRGPGADRLTVSVQDQGIGISHRDQENLFRTFRRIRRPETESIPGTGLGLYLVKSLLDLMQGDIWVESDVDQGATFFVALPTTPEGVGQQAGSA